MNNRWILGTGMAVAMLGLCSTAQGFEVSNSYYFSEFKGNVALCKQAISDLGDKDVEDSSYALIGDHISKSSFGNSILYKEISHTHCHFSRSQRRMICRKGSPITTMTTKFVCHRNGYVDISINEKGTDSCKEGYCISDSRKEDIEEYRNQIDQMIPHALAATAKTKKDSKTGMEFVWIPKGCFTMGSEDGDKDERMPHKVCFKKGFWMGKYEVTQGQVKALFDNFNVEDRNKPINSVSWEDTQSFIHKLNTQTGKHFRLPSEAEWEYAARAGTTTKWSWGDNDVKRFALYRDNSNVDTLIAQGADFNVVIQEVGSHLPNQWGLHDMYGNVLEWVQDCYHKNYRGAPTNGSARETGDCSSRVLRGGSFMSDLESLRSTARSRSEPTFNVPNYGFRLVQD